MLNYTPIQQSPSQINLPFTFKDIFKDASIRFKDRIKQYLLCTLYLTLIFIPASVIVVFSIVFKNYLLTVLSFLTIPFLIYFTIWFTLAAFQVIISESKIKASESLKITKPLIFKAIWFFTLSSLFSIGLIPLLGIASPILLILWSYWGLFSIFVIIEKQENGLKNLWLSKQLVSQQFWKIVGYTFLLQLIGIILNVIPIVGTILGLLVFNFILFFDFEIYRRLEIPNNIKTPKIWIWFSIIGFLYSPFWIYSINKTMISNTDYISQNLNKYINKNDYKTTIQNNNVNKINETYNATKKEPKDFIIGSQINKSTNLNDRVLIVTEVKRNVTPDKYDKVNQSIEELINIKVSIKNTGQKQIDISKLDFIIKTLNKEYEAIYSDSVSYKDKLNFTPLQPNSIIEGYLSFAIPKNQSDIKLIYKAYVPYGQDKYTAIIDLLR